MTRATDRSASLALEPMRELSHRDGFVTGTRRSIAAVWGRRELLGMLVKREVKSRYKDSTLGLVWSLVRPLVQLLIYFIAIGRFLGAERSIPDFAVYVFTGLTAWQLFSEIVSAGTVSIITNSGIIKKIHLPREIFPLSSVGSALFNFVIQLAILIVAALLIRGLNMVSYPLYAPAAIGIIVVWGAALALVLSAANVYMRDVQYLVEVALLVGFWLSPIVYSWEMVNGAVGGGRLAEVYLANPITLAVLAMQRSIWVAGSQHPFPENMGTRLALAFAVGVLALFIAQRLFDRMQRNFAQEI